MQTLHGPNRNGEHDRKVTACVSGGTGLLAQTGPCLDSTSVAGKEHKATGESKSACVPNENRTKECNCVDPWFVYGGNTARLPRPDEVFFLRIHNRSFSHPDLSAQGSGMERGNRTYP